MFASSTKPLGAGRVLVAALALVLLRVSGLAWSAPPAAPAKPAAGSKAAAQPSEQSRREALVIGNASYTGVPALANPVNDAEDVCRALKRLGFDARCYFNIKTRREFRQRVQEFQARLTPDAAGLFYYAGHGVQIDGENYLIPTDAHILQKNDVEDETISLRYVLGALDEASNAFNMVVLDACRNNPFVRGFSRSVGRGLAPVDTAPAGSLVLYATAANEQASDGSAGERNSPFAKHLLENIVQPNLTVEAMIKRVSLAVQEDTQKAIGRKQVPFNYSSFTGEFCFAGCQVAGQTNDAEVARLRQEKDKLEAAHKADVDRLQQQLNERRSLPAQQPVKPAKPDIPPAF